MFLQDLKKNFHEIYKFRYVTVAFVTTNLKARYRRSVLGFLWTVLAPMLHYMIMGLIFTLLLRNQIDNYFVYYFSGAIFFGVISSTLNRAPLAFIQNVVIYEIINFFLSATALLVLGMLFGYLKLSFITFASLIPIALIAIFLFGLAAIISLAAVYFRDLLHIVPAVLQATFFATPIIYNREMIPEKYQIFIDINPFYYFLDAFRAPLLRQEFPDFVVLGWLLLLSVLSFLIGYFLINKFDNKIVFKL